MVWLVLGWIQPYPATLYKFCIILAMNSFSAARDSSKGKEGPEAGHGRGECKSLTGVQRCSFAVYRQGDGRWERLSHMTHEPGCF